MIKRWRHVASSQCLIINIYPFSFVLLHNARKAPTVKSSGDFGINVLFVLSNCIIVIILLALVSFVYREKERERKNKKKWNVLQSLIRCRSFNDERINLINVKVPHLRTKSPDIFHPRQNAEVNLNSSVYFVVICIKWSRRTP